MVGVTVVEKGAHKRQDLWWLMRNLVNISLKWPTSSVIWSRRFSTRCSKRPTRLSRLVTRSWVQHYLAQAFPEPVPRAGRGGRGELSSAAHVQRCEWTRDVFLLCAYTSLRHGDAQELGWQHVFDEQELIKKQLNKTTVVGLIPYLDDDVFRPVALLESYRPLGLATCLPFVRAPWRYLPHITHITHLARITRLKLGMQVGRKTDATVKVYQGVPKSLAMLATGHQTYAQFNVYLGIDEQERLASHRLTARRLPKPPG
jgi:integrase